MAELTAGSVQQLLDVLERARRNHEHGIPLPTAYHDAVRDVAKSYRVAYQTIGDFRRRLGFKAIDEFMELLGRWFRGENGPLAERVSRYSTPGVRPHIKRFFETGAGISAMNSPARTEKALGAEPHASLGQDRTLARSEADSIRLTLAPETKRRLQLAQLAGIGSSLEEAAVQLIERGFLSERARIRRFLDSTVGD